MTLLRSNGGTFVATAFLVCGLLAGCETNSQTNANGNEEKTGKTADGKSKAPLKIEIPTTPPAKPLPAYEPPEEVRLTDVTPAEFKAFLAKHKGRAILIDYWATYCRPCLKQFPHTIALSRKYAKEGLVVISISMDDFERRSLALKRLNEKKAIVVNFFSNDKVDPEKRLELFGLPEDKGMPYYKIYGPDGKLVKAVFGAKKSDEIDAAVLTALGYK